VAADKAKDAVAVDLAAVAPKSSMGMSTVAAEAIMAAVAEATTVALVATAVAAATVAVAAVAAASMAAAATTAAALAAAAADPLPMERQQTLSSISKTGIIATLMAVMWITTTPVQRVPTRANTISVLPPMQIPWGAT
jgi:hypothetical protein